MKKLLLAAVVTAFAGMAAQAQSYSNAVMALNPIGYWPLSENVAPSPSYVATNYGTLGSLGNGYYANTFPDSLGSAPYTLFNTPVPGVLSDGDTAAAFNTNSANVGDPSGYMVIPRRSPGLTPANAFSAEVWVEPLGGDPNDPSGASYASTEWTSIIKEGYGGNGYGDGGDASGNGYGWSVGLAGIYTIGYPVGWYTPGPTQLLTNAVWTVDFFNGKVGSPSLEFDVPMYEPTPQWFHLVLSYDGTNANFYTNGVLAATTVLGTPESTNKMWAGGSTPSTSPTGAYVFNPVNGANFIPDRVNPVVLGTINMNANFINLGYPNLDQGATIGFDEQTYNGFMDEAAIYTNALSASTVTKHFADATASDHTLYTNDVLSLNPPIYLRFDEPTYVEPPSTEYSTMPGYGSTPINAVVQPNVLPGVPGPGDQGFGATGDAVAFDGLDGALDVPGVSGGPLDPTGNAPMSLVFWFKGNPGQESRFETIVGRGDAGWRSSIDGQGLIHWNPGASPEIMTPRNYNDGAWHQVVGVSDGTTAYLYVDNQLTITNGPVTGLGGSQYDLYIGGAPDYTITKPNGSAERMFAGDVAQVAFFGTALTPAQIQTLYFAANLPPSILTQPANPTVIATTESGSLDVVASGTPPLSYQWLQNGAAIANTGSFTGANSNILTIANASSADNGTYAVVITNAYGAVTSAPSVVTVSSAPFITAQPTPAVSTIYAGNDVSFSVAVVGAAPLTYQWLENNAPISGATGTNLVIPAPVGSNNFTVQVQNGDGTTTSSNAVVIGDKFVAGASGFALNFNDAGNGAYEGLGVYPDAAANTNWNAIPNAPGGTTAAAKDSAGATTLSTLSMVYGFNNGANDGALNNQPCFLVEYEAGINSGSPGIGTTANPEGSFQFNDVPPGNYTLYVYSANYDGNRGSIIDLASANGGVADQGLNGTTNNGGDSCVPLIEGNNYVFFNNVVPDQFGNIAGTYIPNPAGIMTGEGQVDAFQLVLTPSTTVAPITIASGASGSVVITWTSGALQSSTSVTGPWTAVTGTSPLTVATSGSQMFYRVQ